MLGSALARLETVSRTTSSRAEELEVAESRIRDADVAFESAKLLRLNILREGGAAVLSQANQQPAIALQLLS